MEGSKEASKVKFDKATEIYETLNTHYPLTTGAKVIGKKYDAEGNLTKVWAKVMFSKINLQKFESRTHSNLYLLDMETEESTQLNEIPADEPVDSSVVIVSDKDGQKIIIIKKEKTNEKQMYLEHWNSDGLVTSLKFKDFTKIHNNSVFGSISWSKNADKIVFTTERQDINEYIPFWNSENKKKDCEKAKEDKTKTPHAFDKFKYNNKNSNQTSNYGETLADCKYSVIVIYDLANK